MIKSFDVPVKWHEFSYVNKCHKKSNYYCDYCGLVIDRDLNAAVNLMLSASDAES